MMMVTASKRLRFMQVTNFRSIYFTRIHIKYSHIYRIYSYKMRQPVFYSMRVKWHCCLSLPSNANRNIYANVSRRNYISLRLCARDLAKYKYYICIKESARDVKKIKLWLYKHRPQHTHTHWNGGQCLYIKTFLFINILLEN